ncbi:MAG: hypothetical protein Kow0092_30890 [Deferrisomatales bacterium]
MPSFCKVFLAFAAYAAIHSLLLTEGVRGGLEAALGLRAFRGLFRLAFTVQAVALLALFGVYAAALPDVEWVRLPAPVAWAAWGVRLGALAVIGRCAARLGVGRFLGLDHFRAWRRGAGLPGDGVETGALVVEGPYARVRHPMYAAGLVALWAEPHWSANRLAFALAGSLYLWLGALHEERRLLRAYGAAYRRYLERTPRFLPRRRR